MKFIWELILLIFDKRFTTLAGSISFFFLINGGTALYLAVIILQALNIKIDISTLAYIPESILSVINYFLNNTNYGTGYSVLFIGTSIWGASNLFYQMILTGEIIYEQRREQKGFIKRMLSIVFMLVFILLFVGSWFLLSLFQFLLNTIQSGFASIFVRNLVIFMLPFLLLLYIYIFIPPVKPSVKKALPGTIFTTFYWFISTYFFGLYIKYFSNLDQIYGALALLLIFMLYLFILTNGLIIGFIINFKFQKKVGNK